MYNIYLENYKKTGLKPELWKLLFVLLLEQQDKLIYDKSETQLEFVENNEQIINNNINKLIIDFDIILEESSKNKNMNNFLSLVWKHFSYAIDSITFVLAIGKNLTNEEIYKEYNISLEAIHRSEKKLVFRKMRKS